MKKLIATAAFFLSLFATQAQDYIDLLNVVYWNAPAADLIDLDGSVALENVTINGVAPIVLDSNNVLLLGGEYSQVNVITRYAGNRYAQMLYGINLQLGYKKTWSEKFQTLVMAIPRLNSDLESVQSNHFQVGALMVNTIRKNKDFAWKLGAYYNTEYYGPFLVPLLGLDWKMNAKWKLKLMLPLSARLRYQAKEKLAFGFAFDGSNGSYRLSDADDSYVDKLENYAGLFTDIYITKTFVLNLKARYSFLRYYRAYPATEQVGLKMGPFSFNDNREIPPVDFLDGIALEARLIFRFPLD